jgi:hypothetical protein
LRSSWYSTRPAIFSRSDTASLAVSFWTKGHDGR